MKKIAFLLCALFALGCGENDKWETVKGNIDDEQFPNYEIYFQNPDTGIFCGSKLNGNLKTFSTSNSSMPRIMMTTTAGRNWIEVPMPTNVTGNVFRAVCKNSTIMCLIGNTLYKTTNLGRNWHIVFPFPLKPYHLNILDASLAYFVFITDSSKHLIKYENDQVDTVHSLPEDREHRFSNGSLYSIQSNDSLIDQEVTEEDLASGQVKRYRLPHAEKPYFIKRLNQRLSIVVANQKLIVIDSAQISTYYPSVLENYKAKEVLAKENLIVCICYNRDKSKEALIDFYFTSKDYGRTWHLLQKEPASNRKKFHFKDSMIISYLYPFGMQTLKL